VEQSCISEDQKYQGALYKDKSSRQSKKSVKISEHERQAPRKAYVEDAPDPDTGTTISIVEALPVAPEPPSALPQQPNVNVFDFLVTEDTPNASRVSLAALHDSPKIPSYPPSIIGTEISKKPSHKNHDPDYEMRGFSYGTTATPSIHQEIPSTHQKPRTRPPVEYFTPSAKDLERDALTIPKARSTDKKRKRHHVEELDLTAVRRPSQSSEDAIMSDAPPPILHSGLTGGLNRLLGKSKFPPSPDYSNEDRSPASPVKRSKASSQPSQTLIVRDKSRGRSKPSSAVVKVRKRRTSDESRPRKHHRSHHHRSDDGTSHHSDKPKRKAIEYHPSTSSTTGEGRQLVPYKNKAELFMSFVTKGEESEKGMSVHKVLKRYHREVGREGKEGEEKELWKNIRMRRNARGEVLIFF